MGLVDALTAPLIAPWTLALAAHHRTRRDLAERLGLEVAPVQPGALWLHAASVGEGRAALALARAWSGPVVITTDTDTGVRAVRERLAAGGGDARVVAQVRPIDHPWTLAPLWSDARPVAVAFVEGAWWPGLAAVARRAAVPLLRVSACAGPRTRRWPALQRWFRADGVWARDAREAAFFQPYADDVVVGSDLKGGGDTPPRTLRWDRPFLAGGSTWPADERALLAAWGELRRRPEGEPLGLLFAPRDPQRASEIVALAPAGSRVWLRSRDGLAPPPDADVVVLDSLGELPGALTGCRALLVGGSFDVRRGAHAPFDGWNAGVPTVAGPYDGKNGAALSRCGTLRVDRAEGLTDALVRALNLPPPHGAAGPGGGEEPAIACARWLRGRVGASAPESAPRPWAAPLVPLWALAARWTRASRSRRAARLGVPVVAVGSVNARGGGKTSTARAVAAWFSSRGMRVGVAVRGHRRILGGGSPALSVPVASVERLGDEGLLHARDGHLVCACPDLGVAARTLSDEGVDVIVVDDGLSAAQVVVDVQIEVVDARFPSARGPQPAGDARHLALPASRCVVWHHGPAPAGALSAVRTPGPWRRGDAVVPPPDGPVAAFAGLARSADVLEDASFPLGRWRALADHQPIDDLLAAEIVVWAGGLPLVTTAKDAARCPAALLDQVRWRDLAVEIPGIDAWLSPVLAPRAPPR